MLMDIDLVGQMLEDKGLTHAQIDEYFEHHGVEGIKWSARQSRKEFLNNSKTVRSIIEGSFKERPLKIKQIRTDRNKTEILDKVRSKSFKEKYQTATIAVKGAMATHILAHDVFVSSTISQVKNQDENGYMQELTTAQQILNEMHQS